MLNFIALKLLIFKIYNFFLLFSFLDPVTKKALNAKVVLQLYINPDSYQVGPQTIAATSEIDPKFSNQEIEWFTKGRGSFFFTDCLLNLMKLIKVQFFFLGF